MAEKFFVMGIGFFVTTLVARYLGPEQYGVLSYAISVTGIFSVTGHLGLVGLLSREIVKKNSDQNQLLGTSFALKFFGSIIGILFLILYAFFVEKNQNVEFWVLLIVASSLLFKSVDVIVIWFQAHLQAKLIAIAQITTLLFSSILKIAMVLCGANLLFFAFSVPLQTFFLAFFLIILFNRKSGFPIAKWSFSLSKARELLSSSQFIFLASILATIYLKIDQVMIKWLVGTEEVGIYAIAATLSEVWYFVPTAIVTSLFPKFIQLKKNDPKWYHYRLQQTFELLFYSSLAVALLITFVSEPVILLFFGDKYRMSISILNIHIWASLFIFMRAAFSQWLIIENALSFSLITQGCGALANVGLNLLLIPKYGGRGAAIATLLSYAIASYFSLLLFSKTRIIFWMMTKAILAPILYPLHHIIKKIR